MKRTIIILSIILLLTGCSNMNHNEINDYQAKIKEADKLLKDGKTQNAIEAYKEAIKIDNTNDEAYISLYNVYLSNEDYLACDNLLKEALNNIQSDKIKSLKDNLEAEGYKIINESFITHTDYDKYLGHNLDVNIPTSKKELKYEEIFKNVYSIYNNKNDEQVNEFLLYQTDSSNPIKYIINYSNNKVTSIESEYIKYYFDSDGYLISYINQFEYNFTYDNNKIISINTGNTKYLYNYDSEDKLISITYYLNNNKLEEFIINDNKVDTIVIFADELDHEIDDLNKHYEYDSSNRLIKKEIGDDYIVSYEYHDNLLTKEIIEDLKNNFIKYNLYEYSDNNKTITSLGYYSDDTLIEKVIINFDNDFNIISNVHENILPPSEYNIINDDKVNEIYDIANKYIENNQKDTKIIGIYDAYHQKLDEHEYFIAFENDGYMLINKDNNDQYAVSVYSENDIFPLVSYYYSMHN